MSREIIDISPPLSSKLAVWPGDPPLSREILAEMDRGDPVTISALHGTAHLGAHVDAHSHYQVGAPSIDHHSLDLYLGPCQVIRTSVGPGGRIRPEDLPTAIESERVLFATGTYPDPETFRENFAGLTPELLELLAKHKVRLVGIDTPSVDSFDSADLQAHKACLRWNIAILEGLVLDQVEPGLYELIALPLKLIGFDASPVRAILRSL